MGFELEGKQLKDPSIIHTMSVDRVSNFETEFFVLFCTFTRAMLAHGAPSGTHCTTTIRFCNLHQSVCVCCAHPTH